MKPLIFVARTIATGLFAILPLVLTVLVTGWVASYVRDYLGPSSWFGHRLSSIGAFVVDDNLAYLIGGAAALVGLYFFGLFVQSRLHTLWTRFFDETLGRVPLIGTIYKTLARFVQLLDRRDDVDVKSMSPVWCFFSDERRTAVLGLMATDEPVQIEGSDYRVVMVPTAPVPFGGGLFFLPTEWVRPASFGVEGLTNIYVSMGINAPDYMGPIRNAKERGLAPRLVTPNRADVPASDAEAAASNPSVVGDPGSVDNPQSRLTRDTPEKLPGVTSGL